MQSDTILAALREALPAGYKATGYLDAGGQGSVFQGTFQGQPVALKLFRPEADPGFRRLAREIPLLESATCPHLVRLIAHTPLTIMGTPTYLVAYEFHGGGDLRQYLAENASLLGCDELAKIGLQIGSAVEALWAQRIVHRDIKPANIVQRDEGGYVLVDVGFARHVDRSDITQPGRTAGTDGFMSPEQAMGRRNLSISSDVFSLGVTLYNLAARQHPFAGMQHLIGDSQFIPRQLDELRSDLPDALVRLIHAMMVIRVTDRPRRIGDRCRSILGE